MEKEQDKKAVWINSDLHADLKARAAKERRSIKEFIEDLIRSALGK